ncbi:MAG TPA: hypothetical protein VMU59_04605 [Caulobacteraceae bacterium]|nr:hypothetical protein [Caulobacteraceae bacterium]
MINRTPSKTPSRLAIVAGTTVLALAAPAAQAQPYQGRSEPAAITPTAQPADAAASNGVVVHAPPSRSRPGIGLPPDKVQAYNAAAANDKAWRDYREAVPSITDGTLDQAKAYPGLRAYVPEN